MVSKDDSKLTEYMLEIAHSVLNQEQVRHDWKEDLTKIQLFKVVHQDVDADGLEEIVFAAGIPELWGSGMCAMLDPQGSQYTTHVLVPLSLGFRELTVWDINRDGLAEILILWQEGSGAFLTLNIFHWDQSQLTSLFPEDKFHQGLFEPKDLDADGLDEILMWEGIWEDGVHWEPHHYQVSVFSYNGSSYTLREKFTLERRYYPGQIVNMEVGIFGQPVQAEHRFTSVESYRQQLEQRIHQGTVDENFVREISEHQYVLQNEGFSFL